MPLEYRVLAIIAFAGWVALWWLAVWAIFGRRFGAFVWVPVYFLACGLPGVVVDLAATSALGFLDGQLLAAWGGIALAIVAAWGIGRAVRLRKSVHRQAGLQRAKRSLW